MGVGSRVFWSWASGMALTFAVGGCAAQHDDTLRLSEELERARGQAAWERAQAAQVEARAALLESRVARLEQGGRDAAASRGGEDSRLLERLDRLVEVTERLLDERAAEPVVPPSTTKAPPRAAESAVRTAAVAPADPATPQELQLRALAEILLAPPGSPHALTPEQARALRLLLRSERKLDTRNPWPSALY